MINFIPSYSYWYYILLRFIYYLLVVVGILVAVAFFTLFERKLLSIIHNRLGPNKASVSGTTQPFSDASKLLTKELIFRQKIRYNIYTLRPIILIIVAFIIWILFPSDNDFLRTNNSILLILCCFRISVYPIIWGGWASSSCYAILGALRGLAQTISYEVSLVIIILCPILLCDAIRFLDFEEFQKEINFGNWWWPSIYILYISSLAEVNRAPYDFVEGESELVSGFNIEYFRFGFAFIFLAEYSIIIWIRGLNSIIIYPSYPIVLTSLSYAYSIIWIRATAPRVRYDELIYICWKVFLPLRIATLIGTILIKYIITIYL